MPDTLDARPTKRFFIENLTRDLTLEDAILDLLDNAIDSLVRVKALDVSPNLLRAKSQPTSAAGDSVPLVTIQISEDKFEIVDRCGGISVERAKHFVFRFGRVEPSAGSTLGVYGIGLKRAVFKIGRDVVIESHTVTDGFETKIDVPAWASDEELWSLPFTPLGAASSPEHAGTRITIRGLTEEAILRVNDGTLMGRLADAIATTYSLFLSHFLTVTLNGAPIHPRPLPIGMSDEVAPALKSISVNGVKAELMAGLAARKDGEWNAESAGWYVLCNGRVVVAADKTELTGWGIFTPTFVSKFRGFVGVAFFFSSDPTALPWTTTKRGLNRESKVYQLVRKEMSGMGRPVLSFLNRMYSSDPAEELQERKIADQLKFVDVPDAVGRAVSVFKTPLESSGRRRRTTVNVQYKAEKADIDRIKKKLGQPKWGAGSVGRYTFEYYLKAELPE